MSSLELELDAIEGEIKRIEAQIAQWELKKVELKHMKVELKRRQNGALPIARIPPEVLAKILSYSLTRCASKSLAELPVETKANPMSRDPIDVGAIQAEKEATKILLLRPSVLTLIHVCHDWRALGCALQELWSHLQVHLRTAPALVELMWKNAGAGSIQLDVTCGPEDLVRHHSDIPTLSVVQDLLRKDLARLKSVEIYCHPAILFRAMENSADRLESFVAMDHANQLPFASQKLLRGSAPILRRLELTRIAIPWMSPLIISRPHLTHLALNMNPTPTSPESIAALLTFLRHAHSVRSLQLHIDFSTDDEEMEFYLSSAADRSPIFLQDLEILELHCSSRGAMAAILGLLHISRDIQKLVVTSGYLDEDNAERILAFATCGRSPEEFIEPEEVELGLWHYARCWKKTRFQWSDESVTHGAPATLVKQSSTVWQEITVSYPLGTVIANPTAFRPPWSFVNLRAITVTCHNVPVEFWRRLSSLRCLEIIQVFGLQQQTFVDALGDTSHSTTTGHTGNDIHTAVLKTDRSRPSVFSALRVLAFTRFHWDIEATANTEGITIEEATEGFLNGLNHAMSTWGGDMKELSFSSCKDLVPTAESVVQLLSRVDRVVWEKRVYIRGADNSSVQLEATT